MKTREMDVTLTIEGNEVPFVDAIEWMAQIHNDEVMRQAEELLDIKVGDALFKVDNVMEELRDTLYNTLHDKLGIKKSDD